jgi:hypothetical protein
MDAGRRPGAVPDDDVTDPAVDLAVADVRRGADTDGDGRPDTVLAADGMDLLVQTDLDGDGLADRVLRIGPDGAVHASHPGLPAPDPDAHPLWVELLGPHP